MRTRLLGGIAALVIAVVGTSLLVIYVQNADRRALQGMQPSQVLVVQEPIAAGTPAQQLKNLVMAKAVPASAIADDAITSLSGFDGTVTAVDLKPGEQLIGSRLVEPGAQRTPGSVPAPEGMQTLTLQLEPQRVLGGTLKAGDTVGIFVSFAAGVDESGSSEPTTKQLFHEVLVTAVRGGGGAQPQPSAGALNGEPASAAPTSSMLVTVARGDADAAKLIFGAEFGTIWLSLDSDAATGTDSPVITKTEAYK